MFTGIIEALGDVKRLTQDRLVLSCPLGGINPGDSIAVDGCCLTVAAVDVGTIELQLLQETRRKTTLGKLFPSKKVNLERALPVGGRLGGHFVTGHVDDVGTIIGRRKVGSDDVIEVHGPQLIMAYIIPKGCVAVAGVSLTVVDVKEESFTFHMIEHTAKHTTLAAKEVGGKVNLEADILAKYVEKFLAGGNEGLTKEKLRSAGMIG